MQTAVETKPTTPPPFVVPPDTCVFYLRRRLDQRRIGVVAVARAGANIHIAASLCSDGDEWDRVGGVHKALGRLQSPTQRVEVTPSEATRALDTIAETFLSVLFAKHMGRHVAAYETLGVDQEHAAALLRRQIVWMLEPR